MGTINAMAMLLPKSGRSPLPVMPLPKPTPPVTTLAPMPVAPPAAPTSIVAMPVKAQPIGVGGVSFTLPTPTPVMTAPSSPSRSGGAVFSGAAPKPVSTLSSTLVHARAPGAVSMPSLASWSTGAKVAAGVAALGVVGGLAWWALR